MIASDAVADRPRWFALAFAALALNGAVTLAATGVELHGWAMAAANLFDISAILWVAGVAGVAILLDAPGSPRLVRFDVPVLAGAAVALLLPVPAVSAAALSGLALYAIVTSPSGSPLRRAALIFLAITTSLLWGRLALGLGSEFLLAGESRLVGLVTGVPGAGNMLTFAGSEARFVVAPGCSSLQGVSLAVVLWVTTTQFFAVRLDRRAWLTLAGMVVVAIAVNIARLSAIAFWPAHFDSLHDGTGAILFGWAALAGIVAVGWWGMGDALADRA